jgi:hypothetical protein
MPNLEKRPYGSLTSHQSSTVFCFLAWVQAQASVQVQAPRTWMSIVRHSQD